MIYVLLGLVLLLTVWILILDRRLRSLLRGKDAKSLEDVISRMHRETEALKVFQNESIEYLKNIEMRLKRSIQAVETNRFNPFKGTGDGGNQSFSTALINEKGDGVVISSLYVRDHVSVFSKPVKKFASEFEMTAEEKDAVEKSRKSLQYEQKGK